MKMIRKAARNKQEFWIEDDKAVNRQEVGQRIQDLRLRKEISREQLAVKMGITTKYLYEIEKAKKGFSADTLIKISKALSCSCDYILQGINEPEKNEKEEKFNSDILNEYSDKECELILEIFQRLLELKEERDKSKR